MDSFELTTQNLIKETISLEFYCLRDSMGFMDTEKFTLELRGSHLTFSYKEKQETRAPQIKENIVTYKNLYPTVTSIKIKAKGMVTNLPMSKEPNVFKKETIKHCTVDIPSRYFNLKTVLSQLIMEISWNKREDQYFEGVEINLFNLK